MESTCRLYISLPKEHEETFGKTFGEWDYGIVVTDLNPCLTDVDLRAYFHRFGTITECIMNTDESSGCPKGVGFVRYSSSDQAEAPLTNDSHYLGGFQITELLKYRHAPPTFIYKVFDIKPLPLVSFTECFCI